MQTLRRELSDSDLAGIAAKYAHRRAFKIGDHSAYMAAWRRGILDAICAHMTVKKRRLSDEELAQIAAKYATRSEFNANDTGAYQAASKRGILDAICAHMPPGDRRLTDQEVIGIAKKYQTRMAFKEGDFGAYKVVLRRGLEQEAFAHMEYGETGYRQDLPAILYQFRVELPDGQVLHKVGITNRPPKRRLASMGLVRGVKATLTKTVHFSTGRDARMAEQRLHKAFCGHRYRGPAVMSNGNTELFTVPILEI
jgi:cytochrome c553